MKATYSIQLTPLKGHLGFLLVFVLQLSLSSHTRLCETVKLWLIIFHFHTTFFFFLRVPIQFIFLSLHGNVKLFSLFIFLCSSQFTTPYKYIQGPIFLIWVINLIISLLFSIQLIAFPSEFLSTLLLLQLDFMVAKWSVSSWLLWSLNFSRFWVLCFWLF